MAQGSLGRMMRGASGFTSSRRTVSPSCTVPAVLTK
ncbi:hypothetical protein COEX109129_08995 [Corallococcus exiguus]